MNTGIIRLGHNEVGESVLMLAERRSSRLLPFAIILAAGAVSCGPEEVADAEPEPRPVRTYTVQSAVNERTLSFPAVIEAGRSAELTFQIPGTITELHALEGQVVMADQELAVLDDRDARNRLAQAEAEFGRAEAEYGRAERLAEADAISRSVLETRRSQRDVAGASLDSARKALDDTVLRAPFTGHISRVFAREFQNVQAKEPIANIVGDEMEAVINVPANIVSQLPRMSNTGAGLSLDSLPGVLLPAVIEETATEADPNTATFDVSFSFERPSEVLVLPGMTATLVGTFAGVLPGGAESALVIPLTAILSADGGEFVWRIDPQSNTVARASVELGPDAGEGYIIVLEGLAEGNEIVSAGASYLSAGQRVTPWTPG